MNDKLRQIVLEAGTDPCDWNGGDRREAVAELFWQDEATLSPDWIGDCLSERIACDGTERRALIDALKHDNAAMRHAAIGIIVERALVNYPLDYLQRTAEEREGAWLAEERQCAAERDHDSRTEARLLQETGT